MILTANVSSTNRDNNEGSFMASLVVMSFHICKTSKRVYMPGLKMLYEDQQSGKYKGSLTHSTLESHLKYTGWAKTSNHTSYSLLNIVFTVLEITCTQRSEWLDRNNDN